MIPIHKANLFCQSGWLPLLLLLLLSPGLDAQQVFHVSASGNGNGSSWADASDDLQAMINAASPGDEVWVAAGAYVPVRPAYDTTLTEPGNRYNAFVLKPGVRVLGGFPATGAPTTADRDWQVHETILSGDLAGNDHPDNFDNHVENALHVVLVTGNAHASVLDGFTISGGNADVEFGNNEVPAISSDHVATGGGIYAEGADLDFSHLLITGNRALIGGGILNYYCTGKLKSIVIRKNLSEMLGGGAAVTGGGPLHLEEAVISGNMATAKYAGGYGAGLFVDDQHTKLYLTNVLVSGNSSAGLGGGVYYGSGLYYRNFSIDYEPTEGPSHVTLTNVTVAGNAAQYGSGMYATDYSALNIRNSIIWGNSTHSGYVDGFVSLAEEGTLELTNNIFQFWDEAEASPGIIVADPVFVDAPSYTQAPFTGGDYRLQAGSPAIDAGSNAAYSASGGEPSSAIDLEGNPRVSGATIDIGAYERP